MEITEVRVHLRNEDKLKAFATVTFDHCFVVRNLKVIESDKGLILCMPSRKMPDGAFKDVAHPITVDFRSLLERKVFASYAEEVRKGPRAAQPAKAGPDSRVV